MSSNTTVKRGRPPVISEKILLALKANPGSTVAELSTNMTIMATLEKKGLVSVSGARKTGSRGRPASEFKLTLTGYNRVRSIQAKATKAAHAVSDTVTEVVADKVTDIELDTAVTA